MGSRLLQNKIVLTLNLAILTIFSVFALTKDIPNLSFDLLADPICKPTIIANGTTSFCIGGEVTLTSSIKGAGYSYTWYKDKVEIKDQTGESLVVTESGGYSVSVDVKFECKDKNEKSDEITVTANPFPVANFTFTNDEACSGTAVKFTNASSGTGLSYSWDFGDGGAKSSAPSPSHTFNAIGSGTKSFSVKLTVTSDKGCSHSVTKIVKVKERPDANLKDIDVVFGDDPFVKCSTNGSEINYNFNVSNQSSTKSTNSNYSINWGDGTATEQFPSSFSSASHKYSKLGAFNIILTVTGSNGCTTSKTYPAYIGSNPSLTVGQPGNTVGCTPETYTFPISDVTANTPATQYSFTFDDGTPEIIFNQDNIPPSITHTFNESSCGKTNNSFTLTARAYNPCGETIVTVSSIKIGSKPKANFNHSPSKTIFCLQDIVYFSNTSLEGKTINNTGKCISGASYKWTIEPATGWVQQSDNDLTLSNISVKFTAKGTYKVKLAATSGCGVDEIVREIRVIAPPQADFTINPASGEGCKNLTVTPTNTSTGEDLTYTWSINPNSGYLLTSGTLTSANPVFNFTQAGKYTISLVARNSCGSSTASKVITVKDVPTVTLPVAKSYCGPQTIKFDAGSTFHKPVYTANNGTITAYTWTLNSDATFTGGTTSTSPYPEINFPKAGNYTVTVKATNECGVSTGATQTIEISNPPVAPTVTPATVCKYGTATLKASGSGPVYRWYDSPTSTTVKHTGDSFTINSATVTTTYYVEAVAGVCPSTTRTPVTVTVDQPVTNNSIGSAKTICVGTAAPNLIGSTPAGGNGDFIYTWQIKGSNGAFVTASGTANGKDYDPGVLAQTTTFRRGVKSGVCGEIYSNEITITTQASPVAPTVSGKEICSGSTTTLNTPIVSGVTYKWYDVATNGTALKTGNDFTTPVLTTDATYYLEAINSTGCVSTNRSTVTVKVNQPITDNTLSANQSICAGAIGATIVGNIPKGGNGTYSYKWYKSTTSVSGGFTAILNETAKDLNPGVVSVKTWYQREVISGGCVSKSAALEINVKPAPAAPTVAGQTICKGATATLNATAPGGKYTWYDKDSKVLVDNTSTFTTPILNQTTDYYVQTEVDGCTSAARTKVTVVVQNPIDNNTISKEQTLCLGQTAAPLLGSVPIGGSNTYTYTWESSTTSETDGFNAATGSNKARDYNPGTLTQTTWFRRVVTSGACSDVKSNVVKIEVTQSIAGNTITGEQIICENTTPNKFTGTAPSGGSGTYTYTWEFSTTSASTGFQVITNATDPDFASTALTQSTWFKRNVTSGNCTIGSNVVKVTVEKSLSGNTVAASQSICKGTSATALSGSVPTGGNGAYTYLWQSSTDGKDYIEANGANTGQHYSPGIVGETTWYKRKVTGGKCDPIFSEPVKITVSDPIASNSIDETDIKPICSGSTPAKLIGSTPTGGDGKDFKYQWESSTVSAISGYGNASGEATLRDYSSGALTKTTWYRRKVTSGACSALSETVKIEVRDLSAAPTVKGQTICAGATATLSASGAADNFEWFLEAAGGTAVHAGISYTTDPLTKTTTFYVQASANGCSSPTRTAVEVKVEQPISNNKISQAQVICAGAVPAALKGEVPSGGDGKYTYNWLWSIDNTTFEAAPGANTGADYAPPALSQNTYFKRVIKSGVCQQSESEAILITANPSLTNNTIEKDQEVCYGFAPAKLIGSVPEGGDSDYKYIWQLSITSATTGFENAKGINNVKDYTAGALTATTWFRRIVKSGGCEIPSMAIKVTVNPLPAAPTVAGKEICRGTITSLAVKDEGGIYTWYDQPNTGTLLHTGVTYETPVLESTTTYYVQVTDVKGCASARSAVIVKVNPLIADNTISGNQAVCTGEKPADLIGAMPNGGSGSFTFFWEQSFDNKNFEPAAGVNTSKDYQISSISQEPWYRRRVVSGQCESVSNTVQIVVNGVIANNSISAPQTICTGKAPIALSGTIPTGGNGSYTYRWEISTNGPTGIFTAAPETNTLEGYVSGALTRTSWFRRVVTSGACSDYSAALEIKVNEKIGNNLIGSDQTVCNGGNASALTGSLPTGGNGAYAYIWEVSTLSATDGFTQAPGVSTEQHYRPEALTQTSWFRRRVVSGPCEEHVSGIVKITVNGAITANTITESQIICSGSAPAELIGSVPIGGSGSYVYLWEYSEEGETTGFKAAPGMNNGETYKASTLTKTTWFRRTVISAPCPSLASNIVKITVNPVITDNNIAGIQTICSGDVPAPLAGSDPKGGDGAYVYSWEYSKDGLTYETASGKSNTPGYQPAALTQNAWFRRVVTSGNCTSVSDKIKITVNQAITNNIIYEDQDICMGATPAALSGSDPVGGDGKYSYLWQSSTVGAYSGFATATGVNDKEGYEPGAITVTTWYRRIITAGICPSSISNSIKITVTPPIANNRISTPQSVCMGVTPAPLTGTKPTGGTGVYRYVWESSIRGSTSGFGPALGINNDANYSPAELPVTTWFRRAVFSGGCVSVSVAIQVTVLPQLTGNSISSDQTLCLGSTAALLSGSTPAGGSGTYSYRWESSTDNIAFKPATGINNTLNYNPGALGQTTWFKRVVFSDPCSEIESNVVKLTVNTPIANNTIGASQTICINTAPILLQGTVPAGGSGTYTYLWEISTISATSGFTAAPGVNNTESYQPEPISQTTWFRRVVASLPCTENRSTAIAVTVIPLPVAPRAQGVTTCPDKTATISATSIEKDVLFEWYDQPTDGNKLHTGTTYTTEPLSITTDFFVQTVNATGCASQNRVKVTVEVLPSTANAGLDVTIIRGQRTGLHGKDGETYQWSPATGLSNSSIANPIATPVETTTYTLTVTSKLGCIYTDEVTVTVLPRIDPTNAITMNGDNINDNWVIRNIEYYPNNRVQIYTRWGALIYESFGYKEPWNGTHNGKALPFGAYYYIIDLGINESPVSGSITLIK
jgi:gliding motility-associated-like protein